MNAKYLFLTLYLAFTPLIVLATDNNLKDNFYKNTTEKTTNNLRLDVQNINFNENDRILNRKTNTNEIYDEHTTNTVAIEHKAIYNIGDETQYLNDEVLNWFNWPNWLWLLATFTGTSAFIFSLIWHIRKKELKENKPKKNPNTKS